MSIEADKSGEGRPKISGVNGKRPRQKNAESWIIEVKNAISSQNEKWQPSMWEQSADVCVYSVPESIMTVKREAYVPSVVPLGPYRQNVNSILSAMDRQKQLAVKRVLEGIPEGGNCLAEKFDFLTREIEKLDDKIRKCYDEEIAWDKATLSTMIAMDACFILEFFYLSHQITARSDIMNDIMKLQNQIPLFVLKAILKLKFESDNKVVDELSWLLEGNITQHPFSAEHLTCSDLKNYIEKKAPFHLLDLQRMVLVDLLKVNIKSKDVLQRGCGPQLTSKLVSQFNRLWEIFERGSVGSVDSMVDQNSGNVFIPSAKLLHTAGINFQNRPPIRFESGKFSLQKIIVDDDTELLLRNLMAYEECQLWSTKPKRMKPLISQFVCLLVDLIESEQDIPVLKNDGIIESLLGSDKEVADIFNQLCKGITHYKYSNFHFAIVSAKRYYESPWVKRIRGVEEAYCSKPLYWVSILAATAILVMTAVQVVYTIKNG